MFSTFCLWTPFPPLVHNVKLLHGQSMHVLLADGNMTNISLDVHTFIAQNLLKCRFQSYIFLSRYHLLKENLWYLVIFRQKSGGCILHSSHKEFIVFINFLESKCNVEYKKI